MGNFSRNTFDARKRYTSVRLQQGVPLVDADWNEMEDIRRNELRQALRTFVGDAVTTADDGFRIAPLGSGGMNTLVLTAPSVAGAASVVVDPASTAAAVLGFTGGNTEARRTGAGGARLTGNASHPFALTSGQTLVLRVNGGAPVTVTFQGTHFGNMAAATATEVMAVVNAAIPGLASMGSGNDIAIGAGTCLASGWMAVNERLLAYSAQPLYQNPVLAAAWGVPVLPALNMPSGAARVDTVYLDVWDREVGETEDPSIVNSQIGIETSVRLRREWVVRVAEGQTAPPAPITGHAHYPLARLTRPAQVVIGPAQITDLRALAGTLAGQTAEAARLESAKLNRAGDTVTGNLVVQGRVGLGAGAATPLAPLHLAGGNPNVGISGVEGDLRIGDANHFLKVGTALGSAAEAGTTRVRASHQLTLGAGTGTADLLTVTGTRVEVGNSAFSGNPLRAQTSSEEALMGEASSNGFAYKTGVRGFASGDDGVKRGVYATAEGEGGVNYGVYSNVYGTGYNYALAGDAYGEQGNKYGLALSVSGTAGYKNGISVNVAGDEDLKSGIQSFVYGTRGDKSGLQTSVWGEEDRKTALDASAQGEAGVKTGAMIHASGLKDEKYGVHTIASGDGGYKYGVYTQAHGREDDKYAVAAVASGELGYKYGIYADSYGREGIKYGVSAVADGELGTKYGVRSQALGSDGNKYAVAGYASGDLGNKFGAQLQAQGAGGTKYGVYANANGDGGANYGVYAAASGAGATNYAGYFVGNVHVQGTLSKSAGTFLIDHPLDPENRVLRHNFVESPEYLCLYRGRVTLGKDGTATVTLPEYFAALTDEEGATVLLTCIGKPFLVAYQWNRGNTSFTVRGDAGGEVSWMAMADRDDPAIHLLRQPVEEDKTGEQFVPGEFLNPDAFPRRARKPARGRAKPTGAAVDAAAARAAEPSPEEEMERTRRESERLRGEGQRQEQAARERLRTETERSQEMRARREDEQRRLRERADDAGTPPDADADAGGKKKKKG